MANWTALHPNSIFGTILESNHSIDGSFEYASLVAYDSYLINFTDKTVFVVFTQKTKIEFVVHKRTEASEDGTKYKEADDDMLCGF